MSATPSPVSVTSARSRSRRPAAPGAVSWQRWCATTGTSCSRSTLADRAVPLIDPRISGSVALVRAIRRFTVRPVLPSAPGRAGRPRRQPAVVLAPGDPGRLRGRRPRPVGVDRPRPGPAARRGRPRRGSTSWPPTRRSSPGSRPRTTTSTAYLTGDRWYQRRLAAGVDGPARDRLLLAGVRHHRGAAAVLRRSRHPGRRPPEGRQRPRRARSSASGCSTSTATSSRRSPGRAGSRRPTRSSTPTGCRSRCCARRTATRAMISIALPDGPELLARIWVASVGRVPLLMLDTDVEGNPDHYREVTDRLYGGTSEHRLRQELLLGVGGVRALRVFSPHHRPPGARGVPHQRGPRRLPRPRADPRAHRGRGRPEARLRHRARGRSRVDRVHHPHPGPGRHRPLPAHPRRAVLQRRGRDPRRTGRPDPAARHRGLRGRRPVRLQHGGDGLPARPARQRRLPAARPRQPRDVPGTVAGLRRGRGADRLDHQRRARPDLGGPRGHRAGRPARAPTPSPTTPRPSGPRSTRSPAPTSGRPSARCASASSSTPASGWPARARSAAPPRPSSAGSRPRSTPTC